MKLGIHADCLTVEFDETDTYAWRANWPDSTLPDTFGALFDSNGLVDGENIENIDGHEFDAIIADAVRDRLAQSHALYSVVCGHGDNPAQLIQGKNKAAREYAARQSAADGVMDAFIAINDFGERIKCQAFDHLPRNAWLRLRYELDQSYSAVLILANQAFERMGGLYE